MIAFIAGRAINLISLDLSCDDFARLRMLFRPPGDRATHWSMPARLKDCFLAASAADGCSRHRTTHKVCTAYSWHDSSSMLGEALEPSKDVHFCMTGAHLVSSLLPVLRHRTCSALGISLGVYLLSEGTVASSAYLAGEIRRPPILLELQRK